LTFAIYIIGHFGEDLKHLDNIVESQALAQLARGVYYVMPNLAALDVKSDVVHGVAVSGQHALAASAATGLYVALILVAATVIFSRRDLK
jgi:ABC-type transport system involved in multi-copper enzyme maturation permease subunit